jgi:hypothetical protein
MIKKIFYIVTILLTLFITNSCEKPTLHRIKYEIEFFEIPDAGLSNGVEILKCEPTYKEDVVRIYKNYISPGYIWKYEYWELKSGQEVKFRFWSQGSYHFTMKIYINEQLVSYKELVGSGTTGVSYYLVSEGGINDVSNSLPEIIFTFVE